MDALDGISLDSRLSSDGDGIVEVTDKNDDDHDKRYDSPKVVITTDISVQEQPGDVSQGMESGLPRSRDDDGVSQMA